MERVVWSRWLAGSLTDRHASPPPSSARREASRRLKPVCTMSVYTTLNRPWSHASAKPPPSPAQELYCFLTRVFVSAT